MPHFTITKAQILHLLTTFVITPAAGFVAAEVAKILPVHFSADEITAIFVAGAGSGLTLAIHYLHGLQIWEQTLGQFVDVQDKTPAKRKR